MLKIWRRDDVFVQMMVVSSAYCDVFNFLCFPGNGKPQICVQLFMFEFSTSAIMQYKGRDRGQPCLAPLSSMNGSVRKALFIIVALVFLYIVSMKEIKVSPKLNFF